MPFYTLKIHLTINSLFVFFSICPSLNNVIFCFSFLNCNKLSFFNYVWIKIIAMVNSDNILKMTDPFYRSIIIGGISIFDYFFVKYEPRIWIEFLLRFEGRHCKNHELKNINLKASFPQSSKICNQRNENKTKITEFSMKITQKLNYIIYH